jgi:sporadic carbohydrate cluster 2OG-Fe(II) oxygenase
MSNQKTKIFDNQSSDFINSLKCHSRIQDINESGVITLNYDQDKYPFADAMVNSLIKRGYIDKEISLDQLHKYLLPEDMNVDPNQINNVIKSLYEADFEMTNLYNQFISDVIVPAIGTNCFIQKTPTNRFSFPFSQGMTDRYYHNDIMLGHPPEEINIWIPFTDSSKSRSFQILPLSFSLEMLEMYQYNLPDLHNAIWNDDDLFSLFQKKANCVELKPGEVLLFDSRCIHAAKINKSKYSRVSMDVRVLPVEDYDNLPFTYIGTGRKESHFIPGDYYNDNPEIITN